MKKWLRFSGIFGLILFLFGIGGMIVSNSYAEFFLIAHVVLGMALMLFWFLSHGIKNLNAAGAIIKGRTTRFGANALIYTAIVAGIFVAINWISYKNNKRWDFTEEGVYSLAPYTQNLLKNLKEPLKIVGFKVGQDPEKLKDLIALYKNANPGKVTAELVDPRAKPHLIEKYQMKQGNVIYLAYGDGDKAAVSRIGEVEEEGLTNAIIKLTRGSEKKVYFVQGHEEPGITDTAPSGFKEFAEALSNEHLKLEAILLAEKQEIPSDAGAVIFASPKKPLLPEEKSLLIKYAEGGGRLVMFHDPQTTNDIKEIAAKFNIKIGDNVVIDQVRRLFAAPMLGAEPIVQQYGIHPITRGFGQDTITIYNVASTVEGAGDPNSNNVMSLATSSPTAWGETNLDALFSADNATADKDANDASGPVGLAAVYEKKLEAAKDNNFEKVSRVVVFGDSDFINNANIAIYSNKDFALNAVNWLVGEEGGISVRPKSIKESAAPMSAETYRSILAMSFLIPEAILLYGLFVWWRRRLVSV